MALTHQSKTILGWNINFDYTNDSVGNRIKYDYRKMDKDAILYELSMIDWHSLFKGSVSDCWEVFKECIIEVATKVCSSNEV